MKIVCWQNSEITMHEEKASSVWIAKKGDSSEWNVMCLSATECRKFNNFKCSCTIFNVIVCFYMLLYGRLCSDVLIFVSVVWLVSDELSHSNRNSYVAHVELSIIINCMCIRVDWRRRTWDWLRMMNEKKTPSNNLSCILKRSISHTHTVPGAGNVSSETEMQFACEKKKIFHRKRESMMNENFDSEKIAYLSVCKCTHIKIGCIISNCPKHSCILRMEFVAFHSYPYLTWRSLRLFAKLSYRHYIIRNVYLHLRLAQVEFRILSGLQRRLLAQIDL